jgi:hypothetical protein
MTERDRLYAVHCLRMYAHWGKGFDTSKNWPQTDAEWRQVEHGSPCDANVHMARWHLKLAQQIKDKGLLT